ncbi:MAG: hypothetical protein AAB586_02345 [Patescibacteria group bacterium]
MRIISSGKVLNSAEFYKKKKRRRRIRLALLLVGLLAILSSLIYFSRQKRFLIIGVTITGENVVDKEEMSQTVQKLISGYYFWVIPRNNTFVYPRQTIEQNLTEAFPRIKSINLNLDESRTLVVMVEERVPFALYCVNDECFFLDKEGLIFAPAPSFSDGVYFIYSTDEPMSDPVGKRVLAPEEFESLLKFRESLSTLNINSSALKIGADDYTLLWSDNKRLMWQKDDDLLLVGSNLEAFLSDDAIKTQSNFLEKILYLDLRTANKVFYKFK